MNAAVARLPVAGVSLVELLGGLLGPKGLCAIDPPEEPPVAGPAPAGRVPDTPVDMPDRVGFGSGLLPLLNTWRLRPCCTAAEGEGDRDCDGDGDRDGDVLGGAGSLLNVWRLRSADGGMLPPDDVPGGLPASDNSCSEDAFSGV